MSTYRSVTIDALDQHLAEVEAMIATNLEIIEQTKRIISTMSEVDAVLSRPEARIDYSEN